MRKLVLLVMGAGILMMAGCKTEEIKPIPADVEHQRMLENENIVQIADTSGEFKTFAKLIDAAGLRDTLSSSGPYTVFAPTDNAFDKLGKDKLDSLMKPENRQQLRDILTYHVVSGKLKASDIIRSDNLTTLNGKMLGVHTVGTKVMVDNADVIQTDIMAKNGVIHPIDTVLMPKDVKSF